MGKGKFYTVVLDQPLELTDPTTGELRTATRLVVPVDERKDKDFCKVYYNAVSKIAELPRSAQKVFDYLLENMDFENKVYVLNQRKLAEKLELAYKTVRNAFSLLQKRNFIKKLENGLYMVNPAIACKNRRGKDLLIQFVDSEEFEQYVKEVGNAVKG